MNNVIEFVRSHKGATAGAIIGLLLAIFMLTIGFWQTLAVSAFIIAGIVIGMIIDGNEWVTSRLNRLKNKK